MRMVGLGRLVLPVVLAACVIASDVPQTDHSDLDTADSAATDVPIGPVDTDGLVPTDTELEEHTDGSGPIDTGTPGETDLVDHTDSDAHTDGPDTDAPEPFVGPAPNVLLVILDDVGVELLDAYAVPGAMPPPTPTIDRLIDEGMLFERAYANPWCSATRATLLTGQYSRRFGIGRSLEPWQESTEIPTQVITLPERLMDSPDGPYTSGMFGKWHLSSATVNGANGPFVHGFQSFRGTLGNLSRSHTLDQQYTDYFQWERIDEHVVSRVTGYALSTTVDDVIDFVGGAPEPWLAWTAIHAPHTPWHVPPQDLQTQGTPTGAPALVRAMLEAADTELDRLLAGIDPDVLARTTIIVIGDNGTAGSALEGLYVGYGSKSTVWEPGIHVPLIVAGPSVAVAGSRTDALVQSTDVYATIAELAGVPVGAAETDGVSFVPLLRNPAHAPTRDWVYLEAFTPDPAPDSDYRAVRDDRWKLMRTRDHILTRPTAAPVDRLFDLGHELVDGTNLLTAPLTRDAQAAYDRLSDVLDAQFPP